MKALVIPSNRPDRLTTFLQAWGGEILRNNLHVYIIFDGAAQDLAQPLHIPPPLQSSCYCFSHESIQNMRPMDAWRVFSRRDSAIRAFGFYRAWADGAKYIATLDDDCLPLTTPADSPWFDRHVESLTQSPRWASTIPGCRVRGLPYKDTGNGDSANDRIKISVGLWNGVPDFDAVQSLLHPVNDFQSPAQNTILPRNVYYPLCGMNLCFAREAAPLMYFPLMGENQPYRRFDDIWMGIIAKKCCDHLGWQISVGLPRVHHSRASDPFVNLEKESPGIAANEDFWRVADACRLTESEPAGCMAEIADQLPGLSMGLTEPLGGYLKRLAVGMRIWAGLFG